MKKYLEESARTANANTIHTELVPKASLADALTTLGFVAPDIDNIKKALFYGRDTDSLAFTRNVLGSEGVYLDKELDYTFIHAVLGVLTEAHELAELLQDYLANPAVIATDEFQNKVINESGDSLWYQALLFRHLDTTFEEVGDKNTAKLLKRFPVKFTEDLAIHRDESAENVVFQHTTG